MRLYQLFNNTAIIISLCLESSSNFVVYGQIRVYWSGVEELGKVK